jgi:hypothetical protein
VCQGVTLAHLEAEELERGERMQSQWKPEDPEMIIVVDVLDDRSATIRWKEKEEGQISERSVACTDRKEAANKLRTVALYDEATQVALADGDYHFQFPKPFDADVLTCLGLYDSPASIAEAACATIKARLK